MTIGRFNNCLISFFNQSRLKHKFTTHHIVSPFHMWMTNSYYHALVAPWVRHLTCCFCIVKTIRLMIQWKHAIVISVFNTKLHLIYKLPKRLHLRLMAAAEQNKQHIATRSLSDIAHLMFIENCQSKSK